MPTPTGHRLLEQNKPDAVALDHLPRVARYLTTYDDESTGETQHVLYWDVIVQSMEAAAWLAQRGPLPTDPTQAQIDAAIAAIQQDATAATAAAAQLRQQIITLAQSAVGVRVDLLTAPQVRALFAIILWEAGALKNDLTIRPLSEWVR